MNVKPKNSKPQNRKRVRPRGVKLQNGKPSSENVTPRLTFLLRFIGLSSQSLYPH